MKKINISEMRSVEGGYTVTYSEKCANCGKKHSCTKKYYIKWFKDIYYVLARSAVQRKIAKCMGF